MWLLLLFVLLPLVEIALFVQIGGWLGLWPTLAIVILSAFLGVLVLRAQQFQAPAEIRAALERSRDPTEPVAHAALRMVGSFLLIAPGFLTDTLGLFLLVPPVRMLVLRGLFRRISTVQGGGASGAHRPNDPGARTRYRGDVIEGDYEVSEPTAPPKHKPTHHIDTDTRH